MKQLLHRLQRTRWLLPLMLLLLGTVSFSAKAQTYELEVRDTVRADTLYLTYKVTNTGAPFAFGSSNFVVNLSDTNGIEFKKVRIHKQGYWADPHPDYNVVSCSTNAFAALRRIIVNINQNGNTGSGNTIAAGATENIAVIKFKIRNCSTPTTFQWLTTGVINDYGNTSIKPGATRDYPTTAMTTLSLVPRATASIEGNPAAVCAGSAVKYRILKENGLSYAWSYGGGGTNATPSAPVDSSGYSTVTVTYAANATSGDVIVVPYIPSTPAACSLVTPITKSIIVNALPAAPTVTNNTATICQGSDITLVTLPTTVGTNIKWYSDAALTTLITTADPLAPTLPELGLSSAVAGTFKYYVTETNGAGCVSDTSTFTLRINVTAKVNLTTFLEGFYTGPSAMASSLNAPTILPSIYETGGSGLPAAGEGIPTSEMNVGATVPVGAVDVIQIELRTVATNPVPVATGYAWLMNDGSIRDYANGTDAWVNFCGLTLGDYFIVVKHRNHLAIMSSTAEAIGVAPPGAINLADIVNIYDAGALDLGSGVFGMIAGDCRKDGLKETNADDYYDVTVASDNGTGFTNGDYIATDLDGSTAANSSDHNRSSKNNDNLYFSTIP